MKWNRLAVAIGALVTVPAIFACSLRDTSYLRASGGTPVDDAGDDDAIVDGAKATCAATVLASGLAGPRLLVQDDSAIYWVTNDGNLSALKKDGTATAPRTVGGIGASVTSMAAEPGSGPNIFYTTGSEVRRIPKAGGASALVGTTTPAPRALAVDATHVFAMADDDTSADPSSITRFTHAGGAGEVIYSSEGAFVAAIALEGEDVFWDAYDNEFNSLPKSVAPDAGTPVSYRPSSAGDESATAPRAFAVDPQAFYYSNSVDVRSFKRQPTGVPTQLLSYDVDALVQAIAIDDRYVYAIDTVVNGTLRRAPKDGLGTPEVMLDGLVKPTALVVDATNVYVTVEGTPGAVLKCAK